MIICDDKLLLRIFYLVNGSGPKNPIAPPMFFSPLYLIKVASARDEPYDKPPMKILRGSLSSNFQLLNQSV